MVVEEIRQIQDFDGLGKFEGQFRQGIREIFFEELVYKYKFGWKEGCSRGGFWSKIFLVVFRFFWVVGLFERVGLVLSEGCFLLFFMGMLVELRVGFFQQMAVGFQG